MRAPARNRLSALVLTLAIWAGTAEAQAPLKARTPMMLTWTPAQQLQWYPAMETVFRTRTVARGANVHPLPMATRQIAPTFQFQGRTWTVEDYMAAYAVSGVLVLKDGRIVLERYALGRKPADRWTSFSVAKSVTSMLVGAAIQDGRLKLSDPVTAYIPELKGSAYDGVTLRNLMMMSSGVAWNEDYADPKSDIARVGDVTEPGVDPYVSYVRRLPRERPPGTLFHYNTAETDLVGIALARAVGMPLSAYLSQKVWRPYGMERDAVWMVDEGGNELGGCCLSMTLRDYARLGQFALDGGRIDGRAVVPGGWIAESTRVQIANGRPAPFGYGYFWWIGPQAYEASGIYGQSILVYPKDRVVVVMNSAWPRANGDDLYGPMAAFQGAVRAAAVRPRAPLSRHSGLRATPMRVATPTARP